MGASFWNETRWPNFELLQSSLQTMWGNESNSPKRAILIAEENESILGAFAMMELQTLQKENLLTRRGYSLSNPLFDLLKSIQATKPFVVLSVDKGQELTPTVLFSSDTSDIGKVWPELREALHNHIKKLNVAKDVVK